MVGGGGSSGHKGMCYFHLVNGKKYNISGKLSKVIVSHIDFEFKATPEINQIELKIENPSVKP